VKAKKEYKTGLADPEGRRISNIHLKKIPSSVCTAAMVGLRNNGSFINTPNTSNSRMFKGFLDLNIPITAKEAF